jgi:DNA polymerase III subunit beta
MQAHVSTKELLEALQVVSKIVKKKATLPVLSCVKLTTTLDTLSITANNLETGCIITISIADAEVGECTVPADVFLRVLQTQRAPKIKLNASTQTLVVGSLGGQSTIKLMDGSDFPPIQSQENTKASTYTIPAEIVKQGISSVLFAVSQSTIRPELASVYIHTKNTDGLLAFVGTDSFRLAEYKTKVEGSEEFKDILIPSTNAADLLAVLPSRGQVTLGFDENQLFVRGENVFFISRIIDGQFPDYQGIMAASFTTEITLLREDFSHALKKTLIFADNTQQVLVHIDPTNRDFSMSASNSAVGETNEVVEGSLSGEPLDIRFNLRYMTECLSHFSTDTILLGFVGPSKPLIIKQKGASSYTYLVMPLNR